MIANYHTHTWRCLHAAGTEREYVENAIKGGYKILGFSEDECMAFGDHMNDEGMLRACGHPRAVANAVPAILGLAEKVIPANTEGGVLTELETLLKELGG